MTESHPSGTPPRDVAATVRSATRAPTTQLLLWDIPWNERGSDLVKSFIMRYFQNNHGGEGGIRTLVRVTPKHAFQACALSRSATSPGSCLQGKCPAGFIVLFRSTLS